MNKLLAGVAIAALTATAAQAGSFNHGTSSVLGLQLPAGNNTATAPYFLGGRGSAPGKFWNGISPVEIASWIDISGEAEGNTEDASPTVEAEFTLTGQVTPDCSFYVGNANTTLNFGQIGVHTEDSAGLDVAFDMVAPATANIETNVAGCNTNNTVTIAKANNGMKVAAGGDYDALQFTDTLEYVVTATWTGVAAGAGAANGTLQTLELDETTASDDLDQGAWKSHFNVDITIPVPTLSLIAGTYTDNLTITLSAI